MISQAAEYSLRAILCLAQKPGQALKAQELADTARVPLGYLAKTLQTLVRAGIITSQRGQKGGFTLGIPPSDLTLLAVVSAVDPSHRVHECPLHLPEHAVRLCGLHRTLDEAAAAAERVLAGATVGDLVEEARLPSECEHARGAAAAPPDRPHVLSLPVSAIL